MSITPGDATLWAGVLFLRTGETNTLSRSTRDMRRLLEGIKGLTKSSWQGPYSPAVLRFQISFPTLYPNAAPLVTFSSDIFHPLLTPLTTYTYTTSASDKDTVSAFDEERLPPGGFSLRHGFPQWFNRHRRTSTASRTPRSSAGATVASPSTTFEVLDYIRLSFADETFLDSLSMEAIANPGAYHAWHTYRTRRGASSGTASSHSSPSSKRGSGLESVASSLNHELDTLSGKSRRPAEWNWDGVWEERVRRGIQASLSEPVLFGAAGAGDDIVRMSCRR